MVPVLRRKGHQASTSGHFIPTPEVALQICTCVWMNQAHPQWPTCPLCGPDNTGELSRLLPCVDLLLVWALPQKTPSGECLLSPLLITKVAVQGTEIKIA